MVGDRIKRVSANLNRVRERMEKAARAAGRDPADVKLVVVTKTQSLEAVNDAVLGGARLFGENYAEEALPKINTFQHKDGIQWHMIGHIQSRKARLVSENFDLVQSLDSLKLAVRLDSFCEQRDRPLPVLLEFNLSGEETKFGWHSADEKRWGELIPELSQVMSLAHLQIEGLMTMPPLFDAPELTRPFFRKLVFLRDFLRRELPGSQWDELSMGTSADFEIAIQEGATMVRIGQAIFGRRPSG